MTRIAENNSAPVSETSFDLIVIGGGIYGACVSLEAARRGLRPLLLERDRFGQATSGATLRILHGGLRYLQQLDLRRFFESVREQRWFFQNFPDLVRPLGCLMPLYGRGLKRPAVMGAALRWNDWLSRRRNDGVSPPLHLNPSRLIDKAATVAAFSQVEQHKLRGAALWHDGFLTDPEGILREIIDRARRLGATAMEHQEAVGLLTDNRREGRQARGVEVLDSRTGVRQVYEAPRVVNCAGPWCRRLAAQMDRDLPRLFRPSMAFNLVLRRQPLSELAVAVSPPSRGAATYFLVPQGERILAGTWHGPWSKPISRPVPQDEQIDQYLDGLNRAIPKVRFTRRDIDEVIAGLLPAAAKGSSHTAHRAQIVDHGRRGGPRGLISVSGIKFTTARAVAEKTVRQMYPDRVVLHDAASIENSVSLGHGDSIAPVESPKSPVASSR